MTQTKIFIEKNSGTVLGIYSTNPFYFNALKKSSLEVFVTSSGNNYSARLAHGDFTDHVNTPGLEDFVSGKLTLIGPYLFSEADTGFFGERLEICCGDAPVQTQPAVTSFPSHAFTAPVETTKPSTEAKLTVVRPAPAPKPTVVEEMPDGAAVEAPVEKKRRGRPPGVKNKPTKEDLFDDTNFDDAKSAVAAAVAAADEPEVTPPWTEPSEPVLEKEIEEFSEEQDYGDENEDADEELPIIDDEKPAYSLEDVKSADARQLVLLAKRANMPVEKGMTAGALRRMLLETIR